MLGEFNPPLSMTEQYLSLSEAESYTGKSRSTLRRFVEGITKPESHPDRGMVQPDTKEVKRLHADGSPFSWRVSTTLLDRAFAKVGSRSSDSNNSRGSNNDSVAIDLLSQTISMLKTELDEKNKQIAQFQERQRETNFLLQQKTEQVAALTEGQKRQSSDDAVTVYTSADSNAKQGSDRPAKSHSQNSTKTKTKKRATFWDRLRKPLFQK